ncbi:CYTH and CHAD domain-containing protein [Kitasatospora sp. NBC_00240]|uniref:CYTH and CHAD domain-containing protein n=1 Tax=Kitasatospora sp. NBC_00240 TaxID=2903567 RepID=UPI0022578F2D|nr:CYTH and CHAD domain-containing protein [Kitasatospora sp. NBC_00240]MCX5215235.1 CYTH and CHAD domain-containing protein [Kitasatospora sp. NBC_00240]
MGTVHQEVERKYDGRPRRLQALTVLPEISEITEQETEDLDAVYYDTPDLRLLASGCTLRRRTGGHDAGWHLKVPCDDGGRTEFALPPDAGAGDGPPEEFTLRTRATSRGARLHPVARLHTRRARALLVDADGRPLAELAHDEVSAQVLDAVPGGQGRAQEQEQAGPDAGAAVWTETEVELVRGPRDLLDAVDQVLRDQGLRPAATSTKLGRLLADRLPPGPRRAVPAAGSVGEALTAYLRAQTARIRALDPAVRLDEPDSVHRMRVAVRRLRSALTAHHRLLERSAVEDLAEELRWLGHVLGEARDAEVLGDHLTTQADALPPEARPDRVAARIEAWFGERYAEAHRKAVRSMDSRRYYAVLDALAEIDTAPPLRGKAGRGRAEVRRALRREKRRTGRRLGRALERPPGDERDQALHRARKAAKRARYTAESVAPLAGSAGRHYGKRMKKIQKALGAYQDGVVAEKEMLPLGAAAGGTEGAFGLGMLCAMQRQGAGAHLDQARHHWDRLDRA